MSATDPQMVAIDEADMVSLVHYAEVTLGLEVKKGTNGAQIRGKIEKAKPGTKEIPMHIPEGPGTPRSTSTETAMIQQPGAAPSIPAKHVGQRNEDLPLHWCNDPVVTIYIGKTDDKRRPKDVPVMVNGDVFLIKRGVNVNVPYRVYEALLNGTEEVAVPTGEDNPVTGDPIMGWEQVQSYPAQVVNMPPKEEIDAWRELTSGAFQKAA